MEEVAPSELRPCLEERVGLVLIGLRQSPDGVPAPFYQDVCSRMRKEHDFIELRCGAGSRLCRCCAKSWCGQRCRSSCTTSR